VILRNRSTDQLVASEVAVATGPIQRIVGLLNRKAVDPREGMWFPRTWAIHTIGMRSPIDVLFLDGAHRVLKFHTCVQPNKLMLSCRGARVVVELGAGALDTSDVLIGDTLELQQS
jgi:uncharacterized membrane protein (UPF0127 family)